MSNSCFSVLFLHKQAVCHKSAAKKQTKWESGTVGGGWSKNNTDTWRTWHIHTKSTSVWAGLKPRILLLWGNSFSKWNSKIFGYKCSDAQIYSAALWLLWLLSLNHSLFLIPSNVPLGSSEVRQSTGELQWRGSQIVSQLPQLLVSWAVSHSDAGALPPLLKHVKIDVETQAQIGSRPLRLLLQRGEDESRASEPSLLEIYELSAVCKFGAERSIKYTNRASQGWNLYVE